MVNKELSRAAASKKTKTDRRERRRAQSREEILTATRAILTRDGTAGFTLDSVARELALTKAALYYYFPSKNALLFEVVFSELRAEAEAIAAAVEGTGSGAEALRALVETVLEHYGKRMDAFRLAYLYGQVAGPANLRPTPEMLERTRPINDLIYGTVQRKLDADGAAKRSSPHTRRLAFLAHMAAIGLLTMKGMVEAYGDPLVHSDPDLIEDLARILATAAGQTDHGRSRRP